MAIEDPNPSRVIVPKDQLNQKQIDELVKAYQDYAKNPPAVVKNMGALNLVTNVSLAGLLAPMAADIKDIRGEVVNPKSVELLQQLRLDTLAAAWKKYLEDNPAWWQYAAMAAAGIVVTIVAAGLVARLTARLPSLLTGGAAANGPGLTPEQVEALRAKLAETNPLLRTFAGQVRRLPRAKEMAAQATAIGKINTAVAVTDTTAITETTDAIKRLKTALRNFDPKKLPRDHRTLTKTATAIGKFDLAVRAVNTGLVREATQAFLRLKIVLRNLKPSDIPKARDMRASASAARGLTNATRSLTGALGPLAPALRGVSTAAATTAGALGG